MTANRLPKIPTFVDLYFDVISPYAWIGFEGILQYKEKLEEKNVIIRLKPFFLGGILNLSGNISPIMVPAKAKYMEKDLKMVTKYWGLKFDMNPKFSTETIIQQTLLPQRFLTAVEQHFPDYLIPSAREFWKRIWETHQTIHTETDLKEVAKTFKSGAFGAPWFIIRKNGEPSHCFWGSDRIHIILNECGVDFIGPLKSKI
uniref:Glutathione S-transferase kappa n=1 Tax=Panagrolaimus sp. PS1159 TaxID=55785 RepID=A0AC35G763_9BILA